MYWKPNGNQVNITLATHKKKKKSIVCILKCSAWFCVCDLAKWSWLWTLVQPNHQSVDPALCKTPATLKPIWFHKHLLKCACVRPERRLFVLRWISLADGLTFTPTNVRNVHFVSPGRRPGRPAVTSPGPGGPPRRSAWWFASHRGAAAAAGRCFSGPPPGSAGAPWTCARSGCGPSRNVSRISGTQTPSRPLPCAWSCGTLGRLAGDTGSRRLRI